LHSWPNNSFKPIPHPGVVYVRAVVDFNRCASVEVASLPAHDGQMNLFSTAGTAAGIFSQALAGQP
jgi:hypothetical protein